MFHVLDKVDMHVCYTKQEINLACPNKEIFRISHSKSAGPLFQKMHIVPTNPFPWPETLVVMDNESFFRCQLHILFKNIFTLILGVSLIILQSNDLCFRVRLKYIFANTVCESKVVSKVIRWVVNVPVLVFFIFYRTV